MDGGLRYAKESGLMLPLTQMLIRFLCLLYFYYYYTVTFVKPKHTDVADSRKPEILVTLVNEFLSFSFRLQIPPMDYAPGRRLRIQSWNQINQNNSDYLSPLDVNLHLT